MNRVFSDRVRRLNGAGKTFQQMAADCGFERSVTWWNKMAWGAIEDPPKPALFPHLAKALEVPERRVAELVAEQWCGVRPDDTVPHHLRSLIAGLRGVHHEDLPVIELMAQVLSDKARAMDDVKRLSNRVIALEAPAGPYTRERLQRLALHELQGIVVRLGHDLESPMPGKEPAPIDWDEAELVDFILEVQEERE